MYWPWSQQRRVVIVTLYHFTIGLNELVTDVTIRESNWPRVGLAISKNTKQSKKWHIKWTKYSPFDSWKASSNYNLAEDGGRQGKPAYLLFKLKELNLIILIVIAIYSIIQTCYHVPCLFSDLVQVASSSSRIKLCMAIKSVNPLP